MEIHAWIIVWNKEVDSIMPIRRGYLAPQNTFIETVIRKFDGYPGRNFVIGNALHEGCRPIIYCNTSFCQLTGYDRHELVQKDCSCDFLYGPDTEAESKDSINQALQKSDEYHTKTFYYKKNGERFLCSVIVAPIKNEQGIVIMYIVNHEDITPHEGEDLINNNEQKEHHVRKQSLNFRMSLKRRKPTSLQTCHPSPDTLLHTDDLRKNGVDISVMEVIPLKERDRLKSPAIQPLLQNSHPEIHISTDDNIFSTLSSERNYHFMSPDRKSSIMRRVCSSSLNDLRNNNHELKHLLAPERIVLRGSSSEGNVCRHDDEHSLTLKKLSDTPKLFELKSASSVINSAKSHKVAQVMSLGADVLPEYRVESPKIHPWTILHYSPFKAIWDWIVLFLVMYTAIVTPLMAAFVLTRDTNEHEHSKDNAVGDAFIVNDPLVIVDYIVDVMFIIDIFINFRTTFVDSNDEVVSDPCRVAVNYMKGWFIVDLLAAIPFELLIMIGNTDQTTTLIGLLKTARLLRLVRVARKLDRYSEYGAALLLLLMFGFALVAHWLACGWYAIGILENPEADGLGWLAKLGRDMKQPYNKSDPDKGPDIKSAYLTALYFTLSSLTSVGFGNVSANTNNEKAFTILVMFVGALMHAVIFGNVTAIIQRLYSGMTHYHATMRKVREFIRFYQIPSPIRQRLEDYAQYDYSYTNGIDMNEVLRNFPEGLQADICLHLNRNLLASNNAFRASTPGCLRSLSLKLCTTHCPPGDYIIHSGDEISNLYWIGRGTVEIMLDDAILAILGKGDSFGENFGLTSQRLTGKAKASVRALTYCDLHSISREHLLYIMRAYPEFRKSFNSDMQITYDLRDLELEVKDMRSSMMNLNDIPAHLEDIAEITDTKRPRMDNIHDNEAPCTLTSGDKSHVRKSGTSQQSLSCSCTSEFREDVQEIKNRLYRLESSMKEDMKLILGLLRSRQKNSSTLADPVRVLSPETCPNILYDTNEAVSSKV